MIMTCFWLAVVTFVGCILLALYLNSRPHKSRQVLTPMNVLFTGVLFTAVFLFFPAFWLQVEEDGLQGLKSGLLALHSAIRAFAFDSDYDVIPEMIEGPIASGYQAFAAIVVVTAPLLTFSFVLSFFGGMFAYIRVLAGYFQPVYVFSELNERSLALAGDIHKKHPAACLVFTDVLDASDDGDLELQEQATDLGAVMFRKDILSVDFSVHSQDAPLNFFAIAQNEDSNVSHGLRLMELYGNRKSANLYVFSTGAESEAILSSAKPVSMHVRRVDEVRSLINRVLYDEGHLLFDPNLPQVDGEKQITAVVVGMGKHGTAMIKALSWFCQMDGYRVDIHGFDMDEQAEDIFTAQCPELMDPRYNGVTVPGEPRYRITIHSDLDVNTYSFAKEIKTLTDASYVLVSLGDDALNIRTAMKLRMLFEQVGAKPRIQAIVYNSGKSAALQGLKNFKDQSYDIDFIGDLEHSYSELVIMDSEVEAEALKRHLRWGPEQTFWAYEYNYSSSVALAIHSKAKQLQQIPGAMKPDEEQTPEERALLEDLEHRRWNAYMRSEGYIYSGSPDKKSRNDLGKMHHNLIPYADLSEEDKRKDSKAASK